MNLGKITSFGKWLRENNDSAAAVVQQRREGRQGRFINTLTGVSMHTAHLLAALRSNAPGGWDANKFEMARHFVGTIYLAVKTLMNQASNAEVHVFKQPGGNQEHKEPVKPNDPLYHLLHNPNNDDSIGEILEDTVLQYSLSGMVLTWAVPNILNARPCEMYVLSTPLCLPLPQQLPDYPHGAYRVQPMYPYGPFQTLPVPSTAVGAVVPAEQILRTRARHPLLRYEGYSPLTGIRLQADILEATDRARWSVQQRGINPAAIMTFDTEVDNPDEDDIRRILAQMEAMLSGPENAGRLLVLQPGSNLLPWGHKANDLGSEAGWEQMSSFVLAAYGVTKPVAGMVQETSYATLYAALKQFHLLTLCPILRKIARNWTKHLAPRFGDDYLIEIEAPKIDDEQITQAILSLCGQYSLATVNEARKLLKMPPAPGSWGEDRIGMPGSGAQPTQAPAGLNQLIAGLPLAIQNQLQSGQFPPAGGQPPQAPPGSEPPSPEKEMESERPENPSAEGSRGPAPWARKSLNGTNGFHNGKSHESDPELQKENDLIALAKRTAEEKQKAGEAGYGDLFFHSETQTVWYVTADWDTREFTRRVYQELEKIAGKDHVKMEAEAFPPRDEDWVQLYPKRRAWVSRQGKSFDPSKHPRGGDPENAGRFSKTVTEFANAYRDAKTDEEEEAADDGLKAVFDKTIDSLADKFGSADVYGKYIRTFNISGREVTISRSRGRETVSVSFRNSGDPDVTSIGKDVKPGSIKLARALKDIAVTIASAGFDIHYSASTKKRDDVYKKILQSIGLEEVHEGLWRKGKSWNPDEHPRGGDPVNAGRFSTSSGSASAPEQNVANLPEIPKPVARRLRRILFSAGHTVLEKLRATRRVLKRLFKQGDFKGVSKEAVQAGRDAFVKKWHQVKNRYGIKVASLMAATYVSAYVGMAVFAPILFLVPLPTPTLSALAVGEGLSRIGRKPQTPAGSEGKSMNEQELVARLVQELAREMEEAMELEPSEISKPLIEETVAAIREGRRPNLAGYKSYNVLEPILDLDDLPRSFRLAKAPAIFNGKSQASNGSASEDSSTSPNDADAAQTSEKGREGKAPGVPESEEPPAPAGVSLDDKDKEWLDQLRADSMRELLDPHHPMNRFKEDALQTVDVGGLTIHTLVHKPEQPLTERDHRLMAAAHARTAALLYAANREQEAKIQLAAAEYHREMFTNERLPDPVQGNS